MRRSLRRQWQRSLAGVALLLALGQAPTLAATINVVGGCTLVDAITAANTDNAIGLCKAGSGADTIVLPANSTQTLTTINNSTPYGPTGLPVVTSRIVIAGNGSTITRASGAPAFRILAVGGGSDKGLTIRETMLTGGVASSGSDATGGAVFNRGFLALTNSTVSGNTAALSGGGIYTTFARTDITRSTISDNRAGAGGGLHTADGFMNVTNSTVSGNIAQVTSGGGIITDYSEVSLTNSTISGNKGFTSGGIHSFKSRVNLTNSTVSGNTAVREGGGIFNTSGIMSLINSTVSGNKAGTSGGGVYSGGRFGNHRSDVVLSRSLVSGNVATFGTEIYQFEGGVVSSNGFNLFGHDGAIKEHALRGRGLIPTSQTDIIASAIGGNRPTALASILDPVLANNGGPTQTHALVSGSPAIDGVGNCPSPATDQRGVPRPQDGDNDVLALCDIGAFERVRPGTVTCDGLPATKIGRRASETLTGTAGVDVIQGLGGNDLIRGLGGNDVICGGPGNDQVLGGTGDDRLFGEADKDKLNGEAGFDRCDGGLPSRGDTAANCEQVRNVP